MKNANDEPPLVSIGCAVYNGQETLRRALDSVVAQDYPNVEIIICDDGSTDGSREICAEYAARYPHILYRENPRNLGLFDNFNQLVALARGKYFMWADQDDVRGASFVSRCVDVLEADKDVVLCHSHTGVFWQDVSNLLHINTIDSIDGEPSVFARYWNFLRCYSDTTIYGLIRTEALRRTALWRHAPGASVALLFELLLLGSFRQVPETLYFYSAKGPSRPKPEEEQARGARKSLPRLMRPFMLVAQNQARDILASRGSPATKAALLSALCTSVAMASASKVTFLSVEALSGKRAPVWVEKACAFGVVDMRDIHFVHWPEEWKDHPPHRSVLGARAK